MLIGDYPTQSAQSALNYPEFHVASFTTTQLPPMKLAATFRIVTPMFLGGAEPNQEAELRVPSVKGALRFWWRALMWAEVKDISQLHRLEADLFGSSDEGQSRFLMRLDAALAETHTVQEQWPPASWQRYSGYGLRDKGERKFLKPGREFTVHFQLKRCNSEQSAQIISTLQILGLIGGLGSRSRKGWGSVTLTKLDGAEWECPTSVDSWKKAVQYRVPQSAPAAAPYTAFTQSSVWNCGAVRKDSETAQRWLAQHYQTIVKETEPKGARAQFGMPREFKNGTPPRRERRASPLLLHIHQCPNGQALPTAVWLPGTFLPEPHAEAIPGSGSSARAFVESLPTLP